MDVAGFAVARGIGKEPVFAWWVPLTFKKRNAITPASIPRESKVSHKHGIGLPSTVKEAYEIDKNNGNTFWRDAIEKEIHAIGIAFEILEDDEFMPKNYKRVTDHIIFYAKWTLQ